MFQNERLYLDASVSHKPFDRQPGLETCYRNFLPPEIVDCRDPDDDWEFDVFEKLYDNRVGSPLAKKAAMSYRCDFCGEMIQIGDDYRWQATVSQTKVVHHYHTQCFQTMQTQAIHSLGASNKGNVE